MAAAQRRARARAAAAEQAGLLTRRQLAAAGSDRWRVRDELAAERWTAVGPWLVDVGGAHGGEVHGGEVHGGEVHGGEVLRQRWAAVLAVAPRADVGEAPRCALAGLSALHAAGLGGITGDGLLHVAAPKSSRPLRAGDGVRIHETRRWRDEDVLRTGIPRVRPPVAAVQAALWSRTAREAALMLVAAVQQRLCTPDQLVESLEVVHRHRWRRELLAVAADVTAGVRSLGELDFARLCRLHGLPEPDRQVVRQGPRGRVYLDVRWDAYGVVVEVDGAHHAAAEQELHDAVRQNDEVIRGSALLVVPTTGLRTTPLVFLEQVAALLRTRGWRGELRAAPADAVRDLVAPRR